jgi:hypothetical protein
MLAGSTSSKTDSLAVRRPSIDDLVAIARSAGRVRTTKRTIRHWVERGLVDGPVRLGRNPRYPLRTVGQVDTLARLPIRTHGIEMVRFALFIETDSIPVTDALKIAATRIDAMRVEVSTSRVQATRDPKLLRAEVKRAARLRGRNSVLPREVRMPLAEREQALAQLVGLALGVHVDGIPPGMDAIERALGLRSGRGGASRQTPLALTEQDLATIDPEEMHEAVLAATPIRARIARDVAEMLCLWFPALVPSLLMTTTTIEQKFLQVVLAAGDERNPDAYLATFAGLLARQAPLPDEQLRTIETALQPAAAMVEMLATQPPGDLSGVLVRLRPLQRLKLESTIALTARPRSAVIRSGP